VTPILPSDVAAQRSARRNSLSLGVQMADSGTLARVGHAVGCPCAAAPGSM